MLELLMVLFLLFIRLSQGRKLALFQKKIKINKSIMWCLLTLWHLGYRLFPWERNLELWRERVEEKIRDRLAYSLMCIYLGREFWRDHSWIFLIDWIDVYIFECIFILAAAEFVCILPDGVGRCIATSCSAMKFCHIREWKGNETPERIVQLFLSYLDVLLFNFLLHVTGPRWYSKAKNLWITL